MKDTDYLRKAFDAARSFSDDPRTQVGAVVVDADGATVGMGANGVAHPAHRPLAVCGGDKGDWFEHAEVSAILDAARFGGTPLDGATLYGTWVCCPRCALAIIGAGVRRVVGHASVQGRTPARWLEQVALGHKMLRAAGVSLDFVVEPVGETILFDGELITV